MGNDGGSIPDRRDLVRTKPKAEQADKANQTRAKWLFCALSKRKLQEPVVSCALGKLYNKEAMIKFLLDRSTYGDGENICGHIRSLKDLKTLNLTQNTSISATLPTETPDRAPFVCPMTLKEMNGAHPFVYLSTCGCAFSLSGLKSVSTSKDKGKTKDDGSGSDTPPPKDFQPCPNCGTNYSKEDIITLNPSQDEEFEIRLSLQRKREQEPSKKKSKKRKHDSAEDSEPAKKKQASVTSTAPVVNAGAITSTSRAVASELAMQEAKRKATMTEAVKSLYTGDGQTRKETFMTRGTFTRYA